MGAYIFQGYIIRYVSYSPRVQNPWYGSGRTTHARSEIPEPERASVLVHFFFFFFRRYYSLAVCTTDKLLGEVFSQRRLSIVVPRSIYYIYMYNDTRLSLPVLQAILPIYLTRYCILRRSFISFIFSFLLLSFFIFRL